MNIVIQKIFFVLEVMFLDIDYGNEMHNQYHITSERTKKI